AMLSLLAVLEGRYFRPRTVRPPFSGQTVPLPGAGFRISIVQILIVSSVAATCLLLWYLLERTDLGLSIRASADNQTAARIVGLRPGRVEATTWTIAGVLSAMAGIFLAWSQQNIAPAFLTFSLVRAL